MFEKYNDAARRSIFFARKEAGKLGGPKIEAEHLLLAIACTDDPFTRQVLPEIDSIRREIRAVTEKYGSREPVPDSLDMEISDEGKQALLSAVEEAEELQDNYIGPEHLLLAILREPESLAASVLNKRGIEPAALREHIRKWRIDKTEEGS